MIAKGECCQEGSTRTMPEGKVQVEEEGNMGEEAEAEAEAGADKRSASAATSSDTSSETARRSGRRKIKVANAEAKL